MTHPDLPELISIASSQGFKVAITTNGTLLRKHGKSIIDAGVYKVSISVHSFEDGTNEDYLQYISDITGFADDASSRGVLTVLRLWNRGYDEGRNIDTLGILREKFRGSEWSSGAMGYRIRHKLHLEYGDRFEWPDMQAENYGDKVFCHGLGDHFAILADGRAVPCCLDREAAIELGNIYESSLVSILSSDRAVKIAEGFKNKCAVEELCKRCGYARRFKL